MRLEIVPGTLVGPSPFSARNPVPPNSGAATRLNGARQEISIINAETQSD